jgi:2-oxo-4-hydroxy-4-carboxy-5-ureidoimidazoline decarboxylase
MLARRPFRSRELMLAAAREEWFALSPSDWLEAFSHHPKIGDRGALQERFAATRDFSEREQSGVNAASGEVLAALAERNREYERRFGFIFIVCASGRSAHEMLGMLEARLTNGATREIQLAAEEQMKITELRLLGL